MIDNQSLREAFSHSSLLGHAACPAISRAICRALSSLNTLDTSAAANINNNINNNDNSGTGAMAPAPTPSQHIREFIQRMQRKAPPSLDSVFLLGSASEATDLAMRLARCHTQRRGIACLTGSFHGAATLASSGVSTAPMTMMMTSTDTTANTARHSYSEFEHAAQDVVVLPAPEFDSCHYNSRDAAVRREQERTVARKYVEWSRALLRASAREDDIAGFICEPGIQGEGGNLVFPSGYLKHMFQFVRRIGGVCIADETETGLGRCYVPGPSHLDALSFSENRSGGDHKAKKNTDNNNDDDGDAGHSFHSSNSTTDSSWLWACETQGATPDILIIGNAITNGLAPFGAVLCTRDIARSFEILQPERFMRLFSENVISSFTQLHHHHQQRHRSHIRAKKEQNGADDYNNYYATDKLIACAAGNAVLRIIDRNEVELRKNIIQVQRYFTQQLGELKNLYAELIIDVRGVGLLIALEVTTHLVLEECHNQGLHVKASSHRSDDDGGDGGGDAAVVIRFKPPLCFTVDDVDCVCLVLHRALRKVSSSSSLALLMENVDDGCRRGEGNIVSSSSSRQHASGLILSPTRKSLDLANRHTRLQAHPCYDLQRRIDNSSKYYLDDCRYRMQHSAANSRIQSAAPSAIQSPVHQQHRMSGAAKRSSGSTSSRAEVHSPQSFMSMMMQDRYLERNIYDALRSSYEDEKLFEFGLDGTAEELESRNARMRRAENEYSRRSRGSFQPSTSATAAAAGGVVAVGDGEEHPRRSGTAPTSSSVGFTHQQRDKHRRKESSTRQSQRNLAAAEARTAGDVFLTPDRIQDYQPLLQQQQQQQQQQRRVDPSDSPTMRSMATASFSATTTDRRDHRQHPAAAQSHSGNPSEQSHNASSRCSFVAPTPTRHEGTRAAAGRSSGLMKQYSFAFDTPALPRQSGARRKRDWG